MTWRGVAGPVGGEGGVGIRLMWPSPCRTPCHTRGGGTHTGGRRAGEHTPPVLCLCALEWTRAVGCPPESLGCLLAFA